MQEYLLKVSKSAANEVTRTLLLSKAPTYVRLSTLAPLSNYGYPPDAEGWLLSVGDRGIVVGVEDREEIPRDFVPWQNVSYLTDGTVYARDQQAKAQQNAALHSAAASAEMAALKPPKK